MLEPSPIEPSRTPSDAEITTGLEQAVRDGHAEYAGVDEKGEQQYRLTAAGRAHVEATLPLAVLAAAGAGVQPLDVALPDELALSQNVAIYWTREPQDGSSGIGVALAGFDGAAWVERDDAIALARAILARLEPTALVPRGLSLAHGDSIPLTADVSREELLQHAHEIVVDSTDPDVPSARRAFAEGTLESLNNTLETLGFLPATLDELLV